MYESYRLHCLPCRLFFWKLHTGTNGDSQSTTINFTLTMKWNPNWGAGVYGWSENQRSAASLFNNTHVSSVGHLGERRVTQWRLNTCRTGKLIRFFFLMFCHGQATSLSFKWDGQSGWGPHSECLLNTDGLSVCFKCATQHQRTDQQRDIEHEEESGGGGEIRRRIRNCFPNLGFISLTS